jgi:hypothetical protein
MRKSEAGKPEVLAGRDAQQRVAAGPAPDGA